MLTFLFDDLLDPVRDSKTPLADRDAGYCWAQGCPFRRTAFGSECCRMRPQLHWSHRYSKVKHVRQVVCFSSLCIDKQLNILCFWPFLWGKALVIDFFPPSLEHCLNLYGRLGLIALWFLFGSWNWQLRIKLRHISQIFSPVFTKFGNSRQISQGQHLSDAGLSSWTKCARVMSLGKMRSDNYYMILRTRITLLCGCSGDMSNTFCSISHDVEKALVFYHIQICPFRGM